MSIEAMKLALEALTATPEKETDLWKKEDVAIEALRAAIEQANVDANDISLEPVDEMEKLRHEMQVGKARALTAEKQEPVAWCVYLPSQQCAEYFDDKDDVWMCDMLTNNEDAEVTPLYTAPPQHLLDEAREEGRKQERALWEMAKVGQEIEECGCGECGKKASEGWVLYCVDCVAEFFKNDPVKREWQGLTDEEIRNSATQGRTDFSRPPYEEFYRAIEAKLKEKNT